jgi:hypothetical protein
MDRRMFSLYMYVVYKNTCKNVKMMIKTSGAERVDTGQCLRKRKEKQAKKEIKKMEEEEDGSAEKWMVGGGGGNGALQWGIKIR